MESNWRLSQWSQPITTAANLLLSVLEIYFVDSVTVRRCRTSSRPLIRHCVRTCVRLCVCPVRVLSSTAILASMNGRASDHDRHRKHFTQTIKLFIYGRVDLMECDLLFVIASTTCRAHAQIIHIYISIELNEFINRYKFGGTFVSCVRNQADAYRYFGYLSSEIIWFFFFVFFVFAFMSSLC